MKVTSAASIILLLVLTATAASAQTCVDEKPFNVRRSVEIVGRQYIVSTSYCLKEMTVGRNVTVTVRIETERSPGAPQLEIKELPAVGSEDADRIKFSQSTPEAEDTTALNIRKYNYQVKISEQAEPRKYIVQLDLGLPDNNKRTQLDFDLFVGVNSKGKLEIETEPQPRSFKAGMFSPAQYKYKLKLRNFFREYTAYVESISVSSEPAGWIVPTIVPLKEDINVAPTGEKTLTFDIETAPLSGNLISGFGGTPPQLKFEIVYNDGHGRQIIYDDGQQPINVAPFGQSILGAVLLGLLLGAVCRVFLQSAVFNKRVTRKGVAYSLAFGLLVVLLAIAGQVEVKAKAFSLSSSYDNPVAMLMIGLVSALTGVQVVIGWYKSFTSD